MIDLLLDFVNNVVLVFDFFDCSSTQFVHISSIHQIFLHSQSFAILSYDFLDLRQNISILNS